MTPEQVKEFEQMKGQIKELSVKREEMFFLSQKFEMEYTEDRQMVRDIHTALVGNDLGQKGLIKRVEDNEEWIAGQKKLYNKISGGMLVVFAISSAVAFGIHALLRKFGWI